MKKYLLLLLIITTSTIQGSVTPYIICTIQAFLFHIFIKKEPLIPPFLQACIKEKNVPELKKILLTSTPEELKARDYYNNTCLHYICSCNNPEITALISNCIQKGACPFLANGTGDTPLHYACQSRNLMAVKELLKHPTPLNQQNNAGLTPLFSAITCSEYALAELLLQHKAQTELKNKVGETALFYACKEELLPLVRLLLRYGANPNSLCNNITAHTLLAKKGHFRTLALQNSLLEFGALITEGDDPCNHILKTGVPQNFKDYGDVKLLILKRIIALHINITRSQNHIFWLGLQAAQLSEQQIDALCKHALYMQKPEIKNTIHALYLTQHTYPLPYYTDIVIITTH